MPVTPTYPGVYIEELPSGVRTIVGVATSITAFIGRARRGPVDVPVRIQSFGDFERQFGGLWSESSLGYALRHYFQNGGGDALVIRIVDDVGLAATVDLAAGGETLTLVAADPGTAGDQLRVTAANNGPSNFDLTVVQLDPDDNPLTTENHTDVAIGDLATELENNSTLARVSGAAPSTRPDEVTDAPFDGGADGAASASLAIPADSGGQTLGLLASSPGEWGDDLRAFVDIQTADPSDTELFNLTVEWVEDGEVAARELFRNLSVDPDAARYVGAVLDAESDLVRFDPAGIVPSVRPDVNPVVAGVTTPYSATGGDNGIVPGDAFYTGSQANKTGIYALEQADLFNMLCIPPATRGGDVTDSVWSEALAYCVARRAMLIVDPPSTWNDAADVQDATGGVDALRGTLGTAASTNAALYFPRLLAPDPLRENRSEHFVPSGAVAGIIARTDAERGVWKAPAGLDASVAGARALTVKLTDGENGQLNPLGVNCLRTFPVYGHVVWGARTLAGADRLASEWKYVPVRRLALYIEESLYRGTQWVVFEPNDESLWAQIRLNVGTFMQDLFRQGAFQGSSPRDAYFVKCDRETTTQSDIDRGIVNVIVGFAPLKPAEFVIIKIQQIAGQAQP